MRILAILLLLSLGACTQRTQYGECIGFLDTPKPELQYDISWWNAFVATIFSETLVVPVITVLSDIKCPSGVKSK